jgi:hypothetical protein
MSDFIDYTEMDGHLLIDELGTDGSKWATAFCQHAKKYAGVEVDEGFALTWFCNAMMTMHDRMRPELAPVLLPDGSAISIG